jgi:hypothetical protein
MGVRRSAGVLSLCCLLADMSASLDLTMVMDPAGIVVVFFFFSCPAKS